jgi:microcystin-dependent protein
MAEPFLGQLMLVGFNFAPFGWAICAGQLLPIQQNAALFSLFGTTFGGNGTSNFALPNLQGNVVVGAGQGPGLTLYDVGETGGSSTVTLLTSEAPQHTHTANAHSGRANLSIPGSTTAFGEALGLGGSIYNTTTTPAPPLVQMSPATLPAAGGGQPHNNMMPYLTLNWIVALQGVYPQRG